MAGEDDVELRDLVAHTLETKGVLGKIRAQLRANVFLALEEQESQQKPHPLVSSKFQQYLKTKDGQIATALVREFLTFFELDYTRSVFDPETNAVEVCPDRHQLARDLGLDTSSSSPLLDGILHRVSQSTPELETTAAPLLSSVQVTHTTTSAMVPPPVAAVAASNSTPSSAVTGDVSGLVSNSAPYTSHRPGVIYDSSGPLPPESLKLQHMTSPDNRSPTNDFSPPLQVKKEESQQGTGSNSRSMAQGGHMNGRGREVNDVFDKKLPPHVDHVNMRKLDLGKLDQDPSYQDDFHSDISSSEKSDVRLLGNKLDETEDLTMSQNSLTDFDYAEAAKT